MKYGREILRDVEGYVPGEQPKMTGIIKLNTNENPYPPSPRVLQAVHELSTEMLRKYPDPVSLRLREAIAERYGIDGPDWVIAGNGLDDILSMAIRAFVDPGDVVARVFLRDRVVGAPFAERIGRAFRYADEAPPRQPLVVARCDRLPDAL